MSRNGIFHQGLFSQGWDMSPTSGESFDIGPTGSISATTPFGTGFSWTNGGGSPGVNFGVNLTTVIVGIRMLISSLPGAGSSQVLCQFFDNTAGAAQVNLRCFPDGSFKFFLGSGSVTQLGSTSAVGLIQAGTWIYLEAKVTISATVGVVELRVNGNSSAVISGSSLNTKSTANTFVNAFLHGGPNTTQLDDWYMLDTTGSSPLDTYLGNIRVATDVANGAGAHTDFTPTNPTNVNYSNTTSIPAVTTKFNSDATVGHSDSYAFPAISGSPASVLAVNHKYKVELDAAGVRTVVSGIRSGGSDTFDATAQTPPNGTYKYFNTVWDKDPNTSSAWGTVAAGNAELSIKINS